MLEYYQAIQDFLDNNIDDCEVAQRLDMTLDEWRVIFPISIRAIHYQDLVNKIILHLLKKSTERGTYKKRSSLNKYNEYD